MTVAGFFSLQTKKAQSKKTPIIIIFGFAFKRELCPLLAKWTNFYHTILKTLI